MLFMPQRFIPYVVGNFYHVYNRGVEKRVTFMSRRDHERFLETLYYYQFSDPKPKFSTLHRFKTVDFEKNPKIIDIVCYCFMPNHYHLLVRPLEDGAVQEFMKKVSDSYTRYFNTKHSRVGPLFQGAYKAVAVETDEQLLQLSRYIHLNPYISGLVKNLVDFAYSSYASFIGGSTSLCAKEPVLEFFQNRGKYRDFVEDYTDYAVSVSSFKEQLIDSEE